MSANEKIVFWKEGCSDGLGSLINIGHGNGPESFKGWFCIAESSIPELIETLQEAMLPEPEDEE